jgi:hypothetical protein
MALPFLILQGDTPTPELLIQGACEVPQYSSSCRVRPFFQRQFPILLWPVYVFLTGKTVSSQLHPKDPSYQPRDNEFDAYYWNNYELRAPQRQR